MIASETAPVRIGVIGVGFMGRQHVEFIHAASGVELSAVADPAAAEGSFGCPRYQDAAAMLESEELDAVIIANPNALHVDTAIKCLEAGVAVHLEKPVAVDYTQSLRLVDAVTRLNGRLLVGHHRRHHPAVARARAAIQAGEIGQIVAVSGLWSARKEDGYFTEAPWHRQRGAGVMLINLVHDLDLLRHLCGEVAEIQAIVSSHARNLEVEDTVSVNLRFEGGAVGSFLASDAGVSPWGWDQSTEETLEFPFLPDGMAYQVVGTRGALSVPNLAKYSYDPPVSADWHSPLSRTYVPVAPRGSFQAQLEHFVEVVRGSAEPLVSAEDASRTLALVEAGALAAQTDQTVDVARFRADAVAKASVSHARRAAAVMTASPARETDVIVIGGGLAGLSATHRIATSGLSVALIEKCERLGGSSAMSGGWFALSGTAIQRRAGVEDSDARFIADMVETGAGSADEELLQRLVERQIDAVAAIDRAGAWTDELKISAGMTVPRAHLIRIRQLLAFLEEKAVAAGAVILHSHAADGLVWDGARVHGVRSASGDLLARAGVLLTSGGFSRSRKLVELFVPDQVAAMPYGGVGNTGDGLRMAWALGAGVADIGHVAGTYGQSPETTDDEHELLTANYLGAILVNAHGERFTDESESYKVLGSAVLAQPKSMAYQVFDSVVRALSKPGVPLSDMERIEELGHLVRAPTIAALEEKLGIPAGRLERTVEAYNEGVSGRHGDRFGRTGLVNGVGALVPVTAPPFYAYPAVTAMTSTFGGVSVAPDTSVKRIDGTRIEGLYAAGEVVGGLHGASYMTGTALTKALVFGVEAADTIVRG